MTSRIVVRSASVEDTEEALRVLRQSITQLCTLDHENDPLRLEKWLANKTPEYFAAWLSDPKLSVFVAELDGAVRGVASFGQEGKINLCYVEPGFERAGIGSVMLGELEQRAKAAGLAELWLDSTSGARGFYLRHGYSSAGEVRPGSSVVRCYPYRKQLP